MQGDLGFIVHAFSRTHRDTTQLCLAGRLESGSSFAVVLTDVRPFFFLRERDRDQANEVARRSANGSFQFGMTDFRTMDGEPCLRVEAETQRALNALAAALEHQAIRTYESDVRLPEAFLMDNAIHGTVRIQGDWRPGRHVDRVYVDPRVAPAQWAPELTLTSIDIETNPFGADIYAISLYTRHFDGAVDQRVLLRLPPDDEIPPNFASTASRLAAEESWQLMNFATEEELLRRWVEALNELDPDLITGWNVAGFDFERIHERLAYHQIPFRVGRSADSCTFFAAEQGKPPTVVIPGRQVLDGMRIARAGPQRFPDHSLETVAQEVLGRGKTIETEGRREKLRKIEEMYRHDPLNLCRYCLQDARLVTQILDRTGLLDLTLKRSLLIGVPLSRAWTSIAAFDFVYIESMHRRRVVAPTLGVDALPLDSAPGGAIISPNSGLFDNVLVFDFKSLYPSIIRTFNIDPLSFCGSEPRRRRPAPGESAPIQAPNGACFARETAILPTLLERFFADREEAKRLSDQTAAYVYKILMNSFYGVLGSSGCRFAGSSLAGAITSFGQQILYWCRDLLESQGYRTLYGDTDSLFVLSNLPRGCSDEELGALGETLCASVNARLSEHLKQDYQVVSRLELEFEKVYLRYFIPPLRTQAVETQRDEATSLRGRAKGYAGYLGEQGGASPIEVKGMEAVRRDWTDAAKELQLSLLRMLFEGADAQEIVAYLHRFVVAMKEGRMDAKLVYAKALRKPVARYTASIPPHVQAARHLDPLDQTGVIRYLWTTAGPQPVGMASDPVDYQHYIDRQLRPIAGTFSEVLGINMEEQFDPDRQLKLF